MGSYGCFNCQRVRLFYFIRCNHSLCIQNIRNETLKDMVQKNLQIRFPSDWYWCSSMDIRFNRQIFHRSLCRPFFCGYLCSWYETGKFFGNDCRSSSACLGSFCCKHTIPTRSKICLPQSVHSVFYY